MNIADNAVFWDKIADSFNPLLGVLLVIAPLLHRRFQNAKAMQTSVSMFWMRALVAILLVYVVAHLNRWLHLWPAHRMFPSGHAAFAASAVASLCALDRRWAYLFLVVAAYAALIIALGYHVWLDIAGAVGLAVPLTLLCHRVGAEVERERKAGNKC